jgi:hypothetical protein
VKGNAVKSRAFSILALAFLTAPLPAQSVYPTGTTIWDHAKTNDGYTIYLGSDGIGYMIDMDGTVVHTWTSPVAGQQLYILEPLPKLGVVSFLKPVSGAEDSQTAIELDYAGNVVWSFDMPPKAPLGSTFHHDSERLANGNTLILARQPILVPVISPIVLQDDALLEVDPTGKVVWTWQAWQHAAELGFDDEAKDLIAKQGGDWLHCNSVSEIPPNTHADPVFAAGNLIVSLRFSNTILIIEKATGNVIWRIGPDDHVTFGQHNPHMIPLGLQGAGHILVFDNGSGTGYPLKRRAPGYSQIREIDPETKLTVWTYNSAKSGQNIRDFFSDIISNAQRLPNGNTMICQGARGRLFEVDSAGAIVWEYMVPVATAGSSSVYRAYRVDYSWNQ